MRKRLFTLILAVVLGTCAFVHAQTIVLSESFENGLPAGWTQENVIGSTSWTTETAGTLLYPDSTVAGYSRAVLRNETGETQGFKTRLITPVMNLDTVFQPILRYYHAQVKWTADFDTLRVLYRNTEDGEWQLLQEFTQPIQTWRKEELDLPQVSTTYQLCFEGTDNLGRGIVLDSVMVRSKPECTVPHDMSVVNMVEGAATLLWQASYDATDFQVVLVKSDKVLDIDTMSEATKANLVVLDSIVNGSDFQCRLTSLSPATNYVAYVRSLCEVEESDWGAYPFFMKAVKKVPYSESFDMTLTSGEVNRLSGWSYGNNIGQYAPLINTHQNASDAEPYVVSGTALCFTGNETVGEGADIPAGRYVYAATPELNVESVQGLQVRFWGSLGTHGGMNTNARSIIVGVMEDPEDVTTFVPVDTMTLWKYATYEEHITSLATYTGEGKSIAFVSNFDKPNQFFIDNMTIELAPAVAKVVGVNAVPAITEATISWKADAASYSVVVANTNTTQVDTLQAEQKIIEATANDKTYKATGLTEGTDYYVYVKAEGSSEWSNAVEFTTSCRTALPFSYGFETQSYLNKNPKDDGVNYVAALNCLNLYSSNGKLPTTSNSTNVKLNGSYGLYYELPVGRDAWMVFPMVDTIIQDVEMEFYMRANTKDYKNSAVEIGVMTDPDDLSTFVAVGSAKNGTTTHKRFYANFLEYTGDGKYIALRWVVNEDGGATGTLAYSRACVDDVKIQPLSYCRTPAMDVEWVTDETARLSWKAIGMDNFQLIVGSSPTFAEADLNGFLTAPTEKVYYVFDNIQDSTALTLPTGKLVWGHTYYAYIRSVCSDSVQSPWSGSMPFTLPVPEAVELPYLETFDDFGTSSGVMVPGWVKADPAVENPKLASTKYAGKAGLYFYKTKTGSTTPLYAPAVGIDDLSKLLISFYGKASSTSSPNLLYIGVGHEPTLSDAITWLDTISMPTTSWKLYRVLLPNWEPSMGNRVVFYNAYDGSANSLYVDEVTFENFVDATPFDLELLTVGEEEATFKWTAEASQGWNVLVTTESVNPADTASLDPSKVLFQGVTTNNPYTLTGLTAQTHYYVYLKPVAGNADWSEEFHFSTECLKLQPSNGFRMTFEGVLPVGTAVTTYAKSGFPTCWVRHGGNEANTPFIYQLAEGSQLDASSKAHDGLASALLKTTTSYYPAWFTTPELAAKNMENVTVKFWAKADNVEYQMELGVMVDPDDFTTYTKLLDIKPGNTLWKKYSCLLADRGYKPEMGNYLVFAMSQQKGWTFYIDDVEITESSCRPANPILSKLTHNSVRLAYSAEPTNMRVVLAKDYVFDADSLNKSTQIIEDLKAEGLLVMDTVIVDRMGIALQDLEANTNYSAALLHLCEEDVASWATTSWLTMCAPYTLDDAVMIGFENDSASTSTSPSTELPVECWVTGNKIAPNTPSAIPYVIKGTVAPAGDKALKFYSDTDVNGAYAIMPAMDVDDITKYELTFLGRAMKASTLAEPTTIAAIGEDYAGSIIVGVVTDPVDFSTFVAVDTIVLEDNDVHTCKVRFNTYQGDANDEYGKNIAFLSDFDKENYFYLDNISVALIEACGEPLDVTLGALSYNEATISWNGTSDAYRVVVATEQLAADQWEAYTQYVQDDTVQTSKVTLTDLTSNAQYFVYVKALCDAGKWNLAGTSFTTDCPPFLELPLTEDFNSYVSSTTKSVPTCWTTFCSGKMSPDATYPSVYSGAGKSGNGLYWYVSSSTNGAAAKRPMLVSLPLEDVSRAMISFQLKTTNSYQAKLAIGYATNVSCLDSLLATVQYVDTITPTTAWVEYNVLMTEAESVTAHLVFAQLYGTRSAQYLYLDDLKIDLTPSCFAPKGAEVVDVAYDEATIQITPYSAKETAWDVKMISKDGTDSVFTTVDTTTAVIKGLKHSTYYTVYVRTNCGEGDVSAWSENTVELLTKYKIGNGWNYTFEHSEGVVRTPISKSDVYVAHPSLYIGGNMGVEESSDAEYLPYQAVQTADSKLARNGEAALVMNTSHKFYQSWVALPMIVGEEALQMRLDMRAAEVNKGDTILDTQNYSSIARLQIGVINEDYNLDSYQVLAEYVPSSLMLQEKVTEDKNLLFDQIVMPLPADLTGKRIVLMNPSRVQESMIAVDNLLLEPKQGWQTPVITTSTITPTTLTVDWTAPGSDKWNVYLTQGTEYFPLVNLPEAAIVAKQEGLTTPTATFTNLQPNTTYFVYVQIAGVEDIAATSVRRLFKTPANVKIATDSVLTFEGVVNEDLYSLYPLSTTVREDLLAMANNWYVGNMSTVEHAQTPWASLNGYNADLTNDANVGVAYAGERALRLWSASTSDQLGAYAVMPEVNGDYDTLQVNFYARPYYASENKVAIAGATYQNKPLMVGMMTDPNNPATFTVIDSLYYDKTTLTTSTNVTTLDNNGFERFSFRLAGAKGKYIAFSAPVEGQWYIDNISFSEYTCIKPLEFDVKDVTKNSATLSWRVTEGNAYIVQVSTTENFEESTICFVDTVSTSEALTIGNLKPITKYYVRICEMCSPESTSPWATNYFTTDCPEVSLGYTCGFEKSEGRVHQGGSTATDYDITQCWMSGTTYTSTNLYKYLPAVKTSSNYEIYSHNTMETVSYDAAGKMVLGSTSALQIKALAALLEGGAFHTNTRDQWVVMPRMDLEMMDPDTMQLEFYVLPGYINNKGKIKEAYMGADYLPSILVGVMTDPEDVTTFTVLDTCTYDLAMLTDATVANPANEFMFQRFVVSLAGAKGKGEYLAFKTYTVDQLKASPAITYVHTEMYIDDVAVARYNECVTPSQLAAVEVGATTATLSWNGAEGASWIVNVSADPAFADTEKAVLTNEVATEMSILVAGLEATSTYYWTVQQVCGAQSQSAVSQPANFKTAYMPMYREEFINDVLPVDWMRDTTRACYAFAGTPLLNVNSPKNMWDLEKTNYGIVGQHMSAPMNSGGDADAEAVVKNSWFVSPLVQLDADKDAWLTFSVALTRHGSNYNADQDGWDDQFMVVVSEDGGKTWKRENATVWNNEMSNDPANANYVYGKGDYVLNELPLVADVNSPVTISLSEYKGKNIKIGFYSESTVINAYNEIHIGKVRINYVERMVEMGESCQFEDIVSADGKFYISGDSVAAGTYEFNTFDLASPDDLLVNPNDGLVDTIYTFTAKFNAAAEVLIETTICQGEVAGKAWGFQDRSTAGTYRRKGESVTGCDSVTTLVLTVLPILSSEEEVTICAGTSYEFNGKFYNETGVYVDTLNSVVTGCDSVATLVLTVNPPLTYEYDAHICTGSSYYFTENYPALTMSGKYIETLKTAEGCDSIVTLNLVVSDVIEIEVYDTICAGNSYEFDGKEYTEAGEYPITYTSSMDCDSVVTLHLYVNEAVALQLFDTICEGDTYVFDSLEVTEPGVYEFTYTSVAGCDSVVTLNLAWTSVDTVVVDTTINELDLPYFYPNTSLTYPKGTEPGVYVDTVMVAGDSTSCGYLLIHTLTIIPGTAVDNVVVGSLLIKPSLIEQGESVTITGFSGNKATVYVYDMVGRCVEQLAMTGNSIELNTFTTSGVYTVRVMDANGEQHVGRVMVK